MNEEVVSGIAIGISAVCSAVCGLIVAIPLMISNNGLDDSKLFG
jgi:biopolymer transport protein ExbB/TolQ